MSDFIDEELEAFPIPEEAIFLDEKLPSIVGIKSIAPAIASSVYKFETDWTPFANEA